MRLNPKRPQDERARGLLREAVMQGKIAVPDECERCGAHNKRCSDGRRYLHAHHPDHSRPLDVEWLCPKCHRKETPLPCGDRSGSAKLTEARAREAQRLYADGLTYTEIADRFGVDRRTISRAVNGIHWIAAREKESS